MSTRYRIKAIVCEGMHGNIRYWHMQPPRPCYLLEIVVGEARTKKSDQMFTVLIATPEALRGVAEQHQVIIRDRSTIVVASYDFGAIEAHLIKIVEACNEPEMSHTVQRLRRYFRWEWEEVADQRV